MMNNKHPGPIKYLQMRSSFYSGRWTTEEELYAEFLISEFKAGHLDIPKGLSLRCFLAKQLQCSPKRISKKYENTGYSGKTQYAGRASNLSLLELQARRQELEKKKNDFLESREHLKSKSSNKKKHHDEFATQRIIPPSSTNTIESLTQGHTSRDAGLTSLPGMINLPAQGLRTDLDWNTMAHSSSQLVHRPGLLPLTSGLFPSSLGLASGNSGIRHNLPGSLHYRSLADTSALLGARNALAGFPSSHPPVHEAPLSLQHLSFQHGHLLRTTAPSHLPGLNRATSEALRRNLETTALLDEYKRSLQQKQDQKKHS